MKPEYTGYRSICQLFAPEAPRGRSKANCGPIGGQRSTRSDQRGAELGNSVQGWLLLGAKTTLQFGSFIPPFAKIELAAVVRNQVLIFKIVANPGPICTYGRSGCAMRHTSFDGTSTEGAARCEPKLVMLGQFPKRTFCHEIFSNGWPGL